MRRAPLALLVALAATPVFAEEPPPSSCVEFGAGLGDAIAKAPDSLALNNLLFAAARKGCADAVERLLKAGASRLSRNREGDAALGVAARAGRGAVVAALLADATAQEGQQLDLADAHGETPLMLAIHAGREAVAETLIAAGARVDGVDADGETALSQAAFGAEEKVAALLLRKGAKPDAADHSGKTPICYAAARGAAGLVAALLDAGVDVNARYGHGLTALMWAAGFSDLTAAPSAVATARLLIARGAKLDLADDRGRTALMIAAALNRFETARVLLEAGASRAPRDRAGKTAADLAATAEMRALVGP